MQKTFSTDCCVGYVDALSKTWKNLDSLVPVKTALMKNRKE